MIQAGLLLLLCLAAVTAYAPAPPASPAPPAYIPCVSTFKPAKNYNAKKLEGIWYEVRGIATSPEREATCEAAKYIANADGSLNVDRGWVDTEGASGKVSGLIKHTGANPTDAEVTVPFGGKFAIFTIFHLDYNSLFGFYTCFDNTSYLWVFAKTKEVDEEAVKPIKKAMIANGLDPELLKVSSQKGCPYVV